MSNQTLSIEWTLPSGVKRVKHFHSIRLMKCFIKRELRYVEADFKYFVWNGLRKEQFIFDGNRILTKSQVNSMLAEFLM